MKFVRNLFRPKTRYLHAIDSNDGPEFLQLAEMGYRYGVTESPEKPLITFSYRELLISDESAVAFLEDHPHIVNQAGVVRIEKPANLAHTDILK